MTDSPDVNRVQLTGKIAGAPKLFHGPKTDVTRLNIETRGGRSGEWVERNPCVAFGTLASRVSRCPEGSRIALTGHMTTRSYTNKDGKRVWTTEVVVDSIEEMEGREQHSERTADLPLPPSLDPDQDLPF